MSDILAIIFVLAVIFISTAGEEFERTDTWQTYFEREMGIQDSLWQEIQRINSEWELIIYEGNCLMGIDYGDSIMVKKK